MKIFRILNRCIKNSFTSVFRNFSLSMASISCTAITLILVSISILFSYNITSITKDIEGTLTIVAFVDNKATDEEVEKIKLALEEHSNVNKDSIKFTSSNDITEQMSEENETIKTILSVLDEKDNPVQPTFVVTVKDIAKMDDTAEAIGNIDKVTYVKYGESLVNKLLSSFDVLRNGCIIAVVALILVTAFLISNTIKITIFSRKNEINIMRLVGTSNTVIKIPFLFEGLILGVIGSIVPVLLTIYGYTFMYDFVGGKLFTNMFILVNPSVIIYKTSLIVVLVGGLVGMISSISAVRKYLKV